LLVKRKRRTGEENKNWNCNKDAEQHRDSLSNCVSTELHVTDLDVVIKCSVLSLQMTSAKLCETYK